ncbi:MAG: hypothetical protein ABII23_08835 [bacterium]
MPEQSDEQHLEAQSHLKKAQLAVRENDYNTAIIQFKKAHLLSDTETYISGLAKAYEGKGHIEKEDVFFKLSYETYMHACNRNILSDDIINGLIRLAHKLNRFDELILVFKNKLKTNPQNQELQRAITNISTISVLSIPAAEKPKNDTTHTIIRLLADFVLPFAGIFIFLFGNYISRYAPHSKLQNFSRIFIFAGITLFAAYLLRKILKAPSQKKRKNW